MFPTVPKKGQKQGFETCTTLVHLGFDPKTVKTASKTPSNPKPGQVLCEKTRKHVFLHEKQLFLVVFRTFSHNTCPGLGFWGQKTAVFRVFDPKTAVFSGFSHFWHITPALA